jgi:hypothetical protein
MFIKIKYTFNWVCEAVGVEILFSTYLNYNNNLNQMTNLKIFRKPMFFRTTGKFKFVLLQVGLILNWVWEVWGLRNLTLNFFELQFQFTSHEQFEDFPETFFFQERREIKKLCLVQVESIFYWVWRLWGLRSLTLNLFELQFQFKPHD